MLGETKSQEPRLGVSSHSFQHPLLCFPLYIFANSFSLINCKPLRTKALSSSAPSCQAVLGCLKKRSLTQDYFSESQFVSHRALERMSRLAIVRMMRNKPGTTMITHLWSSYLYSTLMSTKEKESQSKKVDTLPSQSQKMKKFLPRKFHQA